MTEQEIKQFACDFVEGKIFTSFFIKDSDMSMLGQIFLPIMFADDVTRQKMLDFKPLFFFEYSDKALPRGINGYPMFDSMRLMSHEDWNKSVPIINGLIRLKCSILGTEPKYYEPVQL